MAFDLNDVNRMPVTAMHISSKAEQETLRKKQTIFLILDICILVNIVAFYVIGPIDKKSERNIKRDQYPPNICHIGRFFWFCLVAAPLISVSCALDILTLKQISRKYINSINAIMGLVFDMIQCGLACWMVSNIIVSTEE
jgi:hypothetical protein